MPPQNDPIGQALTDYFISGEKGINLVVHSDISESDIIPVKYLFRDYKNMPLLEKKALKICRGKTLDIGAGAGVHSLWLANNNIDVTALEVSKAACMVMSKRGLKNVVHGDVYKFQSEKFDTILLLMNGIGIAGKLRNLKAFLLLLKNTLLPYGQILLESTDIEYMFMEDDGSIWHNSAKKYYGDVKYQMEYKDTKGKPFDWLFVDFDTLTKVAKTIGLKVEMVSKGKNHQYLARIFNSND